MRSNPIFIFAIFSTILLVIDFFTYRGIKSLNYKLISKKYFSIFFWLVPLIVIGSFILFSVFRTSISPSNFFPYFHSISGFLILMYIPKLVFLLFEIAQNIYTLVKHVIIKLTHRGKINVDAEKITRSQFLRKIGLVVAGVPFISIAYGIAWGRFNFTLRNFELSFKNLPQIFDGFKIVQISDSHLGSFITNEDKVAEAIDLVNQQNPDLILFTGDMVNNVADEVNNFISILGKLKAPFGKYSILGNHDYGDYVQWESLEKKSENLNKLINLQKNAGFELLLNESIKITKNGESFELIGVENWGLPPFPQYGDLNKSLENINPDGFKLLMSHDPTHWDEEVLGYTDIDLTLSGHTHGAQFGIEIPGWRWSPVSMRYKRWGGLYEEGDQKLYVNTGIGFIGFPGRVGMPPEVCLITLKKA